MGASFLLILLRLNLAHELTVSSYDGAGQRAVSTNYPLRTINVNVAQHVEVDSDLERKNPNRNSYGYMA